MYTPLPGHPADEQEDTNRLCGRLLIPERHAAKVWNTAYYSGMVCITPYLNVYYRRLGLSEKQIGVFAAVSPWVAAPSGSMFAALADKLQMHWQMLFLCSVGALIGRTSIAFLHSFPVLLAVVVCTEGLSAPVSILSDIAIMSASSEPGYYGRQRMFASTGWGIFSALSGYLVSQYGLLMAFRLYFILTAFALYPLCSLRFHLKHHHHHKHHHHVHHAHRRRSEVSTRRRSSAEQDEYWSSMAAHAADEALRSVPRAIDLDQESVESYDSVSVQSYDTASPDGESHQLYEIAFCDTLAMLGNPTAPPPLFPAPPDPSMLDTDEGGYPALGSFLPHELHNLLQLFRGRRVAERETMRQSRIKRGPMLKRHSDPELAARAGDSLTPSFNDLPRLAFAEGTYSPQPLYRRGVSLPASHATSPASGPMQAPADEPLFTTLEPPYLAMPREKPVISRADLFPKGADVFAPRLKPAFPKLERIPSNAMPELHDTVSAADLAGPLLDSSFPAEQHLNGHMPPVSVPDLARVATSPAEPDEHPERAEHDEPPMTTGRRSSGTAAAQKLGFWEGMRMLLANPEALPFFAMSLLMGFGTGNLGNYLFLYLDELGGTELLMGLTLSITCAVEVPIFAVNGWILRTLGVQNVLHVTIAVCVIRMLAYSTLDRWASLWFVLGVEALNGITFACAWPAGTLHCSRIAPPGMQATVQGIFASLYGGFGTGLGGLFGGLVYNAHGAKAVFQYSGMMVVAGWMACIVGQVLAKWLCRPPVPEDLDKVDLTPAPPV
ncbi:hypothetical protein WJX72_012297 [[Myrmecia] bisecta]|uniref:Major facilitator superfamily (MFS) profile domain-containing protein n=1 Tax=[Myrmecia] bisecta TaxID=41462 RepID=A0AAW1QGS4_9CHLO